MKRFISSAVLVAFIAMAPIGCGGGDRQPDFKGPLAAERTRGKVLFFGEAQCADCHAVGERGDAERGPNLGATATSPDVAARAAERRPGVPVALYLLESIVDPDALVVPGHEPGVMKRPEQLGLRDDDIMALIAFLGGDAVDGAAVADARAALGPVRISRAERERAQATAAVVAQIPWADSDATRGAALYAKLGCQTCHDNPQAPPGPPAGPSLRGVGARMDRARMAGWIIAPPPTGMPPYGDQLTPAQLGDLIAHVAAIPAD